MEPASSDIIFNYFPDLSPEQLRQFSKLQELYFSWNEKINLISRKDIEHLTEKHILHSLSIAKIIQFKPGTKILDIGTGGGLPGIPLAIMFPEANFHLVDSIGKKIKVVKEIIQSLGLRNVHADQMRVEDLHGQYDFALNRAVAPISELMFWMKGKIARKNFNTLANGLLCLKGGDLTEELYNLTLPTFGAGQANPSPKERGVKLPRIIIFNLSDFFKEEFFETKKLVFVQMN